MQRIKILYIIDRLWPGGTENQLVLISDNLPTHLFEPVIGVLDLDDEYQLRNVKTKIVRFGSLSRIPFIKNILTIFKIKSYLKSKTVDIVQTQFPTSTIYGALAVRLCKKSIRPVFVGTRRNLYHWINDEPIHFKLMKFVNRWTDKLIVNSKIVYDKCKALEGVSDKNLFLIQNGIEIDKYIQMANIDLRKNIGLKDAYPIIGVVGNWRPVKGLIPFIKAAKLIYKRFPSSHFILAGYGPQKEELILLVSKFGLENQFHFIENYQNIPALINIFDIAVQSSLSESFSNVLLEYMVLGKPIVATDVGDASFVLDNKITGIIVDPNNPKELSNAVCGLLNDMDSARTMGLRALEKVEKYWDHEKILKQYTDLYTKIIH